MPVAAGFCLLLLWLVVAPAHAANFTASLDNDTLTLGQSTTLSLTFEGGSPQNTPGLPDIPGLQISYVGPSSQFSFINGQTSSTVTHHFTITPVRTGVFVIPALTADVGGVRLTSQPLPLRVVQPSAASTPQINSGSQIAFMKLTLPDTRLYVGEVTTANLEIFLRDDVQNYGNIQFTGTPADGFVLGKNSSGQRYRTQIGSRGYTVIPIAVALTVTKTGNVSLGPFTASMIVVLPSPNQGGDAFFNQFFNQGQQRAVTLATDQINVESSPLPAGNSPPNFNGAIGQYTMAVTAGPTNVAVGDPITVRIQISGRGDLGSLTLPVQTAWHDFTIYPPTARVETSDPLGLQGTKTFEEIVAPQNTDVHELPAFDFSYFDPDTGSYRTLTEPAVSLAVRSAGSTPVPTIAGTPARRRGKSNQTGGYSAHQGQPGPTGSSRAASGHTAGVSGPPGRAGARVARRCDLAQTHGQAGEQPAAAAATARRATGPRGPERFTTIRGGERLRPVFCNVVSFVTGAIGRTAGFSGLVHYRSGD